MPMYSYQCKTCDHVFTEIKKISEREPNLESSCPQCKAKGDIIKLVDAVAISYQVHGFHAKVPEGFKDVLRNVKSGAGKDCTIDV